MAGRSFNEIDVDFEGIAQDLAELPTPRITLEDVLERLRGPMLEQRRRGVSVPQIREVLKGRNIDIAERSLKTFLEKGELPGRRNAATGRGGARTVAAAGREDGPTVADDASAESGPS